MKQLSAFFLLSTSIALHGQITHQLHVIDDEFVPATLNIVIGDAVHIIFDEVDHTFTEVSQATWLAEDSTALPGGYNFGDGTPNPGNDFTITPDSAGTIFYVCQLHIFDMGMKGTIEVAAVSGIEEAMMQGAWRIVPNPATDRVELVTDVTRPVTVILYDASGKCRMTAAVEGSSVLHLGGLANGSYTIEIRDLDAMLLSRQQLMVAR